MKWFKHSVHARSEHGTEDILRSYGPAGIGIYWCLLEMLARDTEHFRLRISGISADADERFERVRNGARHEAPAHHLYRIDLLARTLNTEPAAILEVISLGLSEGLFDRDLWQLYCILHSPGFSRQADEYTRRLRRSRQEGETRRSDPSTETLPTAPESLRRTSENISEEQIREEEKKEQKPPSGGQSCTIGPDDIERLLMRLSVFVADWNRRNRREFQLRLDRTRLARLFGGDVSWRKRVCYESMNLTYGGRTLQDVIHRAVWLMLEASRQRPIGDQFAWLWSCIHGRADSPPWVHRPTAAEESRPRTRPGRSDEEFRTIGELLALRTSANGGSQG